MFKDLLYKLDNNELVDKEDVARIEDSFNYLNNKDIEKYKLGILEECFNYKYNNEEKIKFERSHLTRNIVMIAYWLGISKDDYINLLKVVANNKKNKHDKDIKNEKIFNNTYKDKIEYGSYAFSNNQSSNIYADNVVFSGSRGHGFAAEKINHMYDVLNGQDAKIIGGDNKLNGADRLVNGVQIQTKYCKTGSKCIEECFRDGKMRYLNPDNTPMQIEVPSDKYESAVKAMENRIKTGQVPGVTDPSEARKIVRKGKFTYEQAKNVAKFGKIESLTYDAINGVKIASTSMGISSALTFACSIWSGEDMDVALDRAIDTGIKVGGISFISSLVTSQLGRTGIEKGLRPATDYLVKQIGPKATSNIVNSLRTGGKPIYGAAASNNLSKMLRGNFVANSATVAILSTADITRLVKGEISSGQAFKNISSTIAGVAGGALGYSGGAMIGGAIGSVIPVIGTAAGALVGGMIGGMATGGASSKIAKNTLDTFIEDDGIEILKIIQKNFEKVAHDYLLNEKEIKIVSEKLQNMNMEKQIRMIYASNNRDKYAYNLISSIAVEIVKNRKNIYLPSERKMLISLGK